MSFNDTTFRVTITLDTNYQLDLTKSNFYDLIGFNKEVIKGSINIGPRVPILSQDTDILNILCDLINTVLLMEKILILFTASVLLFWNHLILLL